MGNLESRFRNTSIPLDFVGMKEGGCKESFTTWRYGKEFCDDEEVYGDSL